MTSQPKIHLKDLWDFLDGAGKRYMTIPHHTGKGVDARYPLGQHEEPKLLCNTVFEDAVGSYDC